MGLMGLGLVGGGPDRPGGEAECSDFSSNGDNFRSGSGRPTSLPPWPLPCLCLRCRPVWWWWWCPLPPWPRPPCPPSPGWTEEFGFVCSSPSAPPPPPLAAIVVFKRRLFALFDSFWSTKFFASSSRKIGFWGAHKFNDVKARPFVNWICCLAFPFQSVLILFHFPVPNNSSFFSIIKLYVFTKIMIGRSIAVLENYFEIVKWKLHKLHCICRST